MNKVRFKLTEFPYPTLARFGLTQEMIEDLPMRVLDEICDGRHSPVLPVRVSDENGEAVEAVPASPLSVWITDRRMCYSIPS